MIRIKNKNFYREMLALALPIAFQQLLTTSLTMVDTLMIGRLGETQITAVSLSGQWAFLFNIFLFGVGSGSSVFFAQYYGSKNYDGIYRSYGLALISLLSVCVPFTLLAMIAPQFILRFFTTDVAVLEEGTRYLRIIALSYVAQAVSIITSTLLRSVGEVKLPLLGSAVSVVFNVCINYTLIFGKFGFPQLGVSGAAIGSVVAAYANMATILIFSARQRNVVWAPLRKMLDIHRPFVKEFYKTAAPVVANECIWAVGTTVMNAICGHQGTANYAALTIQRTISDLTFVFFNGINNAAAVMLGKKVGAGDLKGAISDSKRYVWIAPALAIILGALVVAISNPILHLFKLEAATHDLARKLLMIYAAVMPLRMFNFIIVCGVFRAGGDTKFGLYMDIIGTWCGALLLTFLTAVVFKLPFIFVAASAYAEDFLKVIPMVVHWRGLKWIKPVTEAGRKAHEALKQETL